MLRQSTRGGSSDPTAELERLKAMLHELPHGSTHESTRAQLEKQIAAIRGAQSREMRQPRRSGRPDQAGESADTPVRSKSPKRLAPTPSSTRPRQTRRSSRRLKQAGAADRGKSTRHCMSPACLPPPLHNAARSQPRCSLQWRSMAGAGTAGCIWRISA